VQAVMLVGSLLSFNIVFLLNSLFSMFLFDCVLELFEGLLNEN
jgi:uncharacterized membrane protein